MRLLIDRGVLTATIVVFVGIGCTKRLSVPPPPDAGVAAEATWPDEQALLSSDYPRFRSPYREGPQPRPASIPQVRREKRSIPRSFFGELPSRPQDADAWADDWPDLDYVLNRLTEAEPRMLARITAAMDKADRAGVGTAVLQAYSERLLTYIQGGPVCELAAQQLRTTEGGRSYRGFLAGVLTRCSPREVYDIVIAEPISEFALRQYLSFDGVREEGLKRFRPALLDRYRELSRTEDVHPFAFGLTAGLLVDTARTEAEAASVRALRNALGEGEARDYLNLCLGQLPDEQVAKAITKAIGLINHQDENIVCAQAVAARARGQHRLEELAGFRAPPRPDPEAYARAHPENPGRVLSTLETCAAREASRFSKLACLRALAARDWRRAHELLKKLPDLKGVTEYADPEDSSLAVTLYAFSRREDAETAFRRIGLLASEEPLVGLDLYEHLASKGTLAKQWIQCTSEHAWGMLKVAQLPTAEIPVILVHEGDRPHEFHAWWKGIRYATAYVRDPPSYECVSSRALVNAMLEDAGSPFRIHEIFGDEYRRTAVLLRDEVFARAAELNLLIVPERVPPDGLFSSATELQKLVQGTSAEPSMR
ncbi:MAG: hypothetical protein WBV82_10460 [Myxococcaceae bacterium]